MWAFASTHGVPGLRAGSRDRNAWLKSGRLSLLTVGPLPGGSAWSLEASPSTYFSSASRDDYLGLDEGPSVTVSLFRERRTRRPWHWVESFSGKQYAGLVISSMVSHVLQCWGGGNRFLDVL